MLKLNLILIDIILRNAKRKIGVKANALKPPRPLGGERSWF